MVLNRRSLLLTTAAVALVPDVLSHARAATPKGVLVMAKAIDDVVGGFDPAEAYETTNYEVCANLYRTLVMVDPKDTTKVIGDLARSWDVSADGSTVTFHLIADAKFDSGKPVTVEDAAFSLQRVMKLGKGPSEIFTQFGWTAENVDSLIQVGAGDTLTITLPNKLAPGIVLTSLATPTGCVIEKAVVLSHVAGDDFGNGWLRTHSAGAGAYRLVEWQASDHLVLAANPHATVAPKTLRIVFRHVSDAATQVILLEKGDVDIARDLGADQFAAVAKNGSLEKVSSDTLTQMYLGMNMSVPEFQKPEVREAIRWAIDYEAIAKNVTPGTWNVGQSFEPKGIPGAVAGTFHQDIPKAKALLAQTGLPDGFSVTLDHFSSKPYSDVAQAIQADLAAVGIKVQLLAGETAQVVSKMRARRHQLIMSSWTPAYPDPANNAGVFCVNPDDADSATLKSLAWRNHFNNPELMAEAKAAAMELDVATRLAMYGDMQRKVMALSPFAVMLQQVQTAMVRKGVTGLALGVLPNGTLYADIQKA